MWVAYTSNSRRYFINRSNYITIIRSKMHSRRIFRNNSRVKVHYVKRNEIMPSFFLNYVAKPSYGVLRVSPLIYCTFKIDRRFVFILSTTDLLIFPERFLLGSIDEPAFAI